jgi:hypothetical protein
MKLEKVLMKTIFKKTLVAVALAGLSANAFAAVDTVTDSVAVTYSAQRLDNTATTVTIPRENYEITLGAEYAIGDIIKFTFSNDAIAASQFRSTITTSDTLAVTGLPAANVAGATLTLGLLSSDATSVTYRVTEVSAALTTVGQKFTIAANATFAASAAKLKTGSGITVTYSAQTASGVIIDAGSTAKPTFQLVHTATEYTSKVDEALNATIDVEEGRLLFSNVGGHSTTVDRLGVTAAQVAGIDTDGAAGPLGVTAFTSPTALVKVKHVINGDFSWVVDATPATASIVPVDATLAIAGCTGAVDAGDATWTATSVTFECTNAAAIDLDFNVVQGSGTGASARVLPVGKYTYSGDVTFNAGAADQVLNVATGTAAGEWTLNGSNVNVPYMVFGTLNGLAYGQIINVANTSSVEGDIVVDVWKDDGSVLLSNIKVATSKANSTTSIAGAIRTALAGAGFTDGKVSLRIVTNAPDNAVSVYSAYVDSVTRERAIVNNDSAVQYKGNAL